MRKRTTIAARYSQKVLSFDMFIYLVASFSCFLMQTTYGAASTGDRHCADRSDDSGEEGVAWKVSHEQAIEELNFQDHDAIDDECVDDFELLRSRGVVLVPKIGQDAEY